MYGDNDPYGPVQGVHKGRVPGTNSDGTWVETANGIQVLSGPLSGQYLNTPNHY
jgi:hypothetical protein